MASYYGAASSGFDGSGQTIGIMMEMTPLQEDLSDFWTNSNVGQSIENFDAALPLGSELPIDPLDIVRFEATLDVAWAGAMAPGAKIRLYLTIDAVSACAEILRDLAAGRQVNQVSISAGLPETFHTSDSVRAQQQAFSACAARGVTFFVSSGDGGSNPGAANVGGIFDPDAPISAEYPASDPNVTAVGGTLMLQDQWARPAGESVFGSSRPGESGSGGAPSVLFERPVWQKGLGVPAGTMRLTPDVAAIWMGSQQAPYLIFDGGVSAASGTSLSSPVWAGLCALINQARSEAGLPPLGLLGPKLYPLIGTAALNDVTSGTNGAFTAGPGYDLASGVGSPNVGALINALAGANVIPIRGPYPVAVKPGEAARFGVTVSDSRPSTFQWELRVGDKWEMVAESENIFGSHAALLELRSVSPDMNGAEYRCIVRDSVQSMASPGATLRVQRPVAGGTPIKDMTAKVGDQLVVPFDGTGDLVGFVWTNPKGQRIVTESPFLSLPSVRSRDGGESIQ